MKSTLKLLTVLALALSLAAPPAYADAAADMVQSLDALKRQMADLQRTIESQNLRIQQLESSRVLEKPQPNAALQPSALTDADWQKGIKDNLGETVTWMKGLKFGGDLRLRNEYFDYFDKQTDAGSTDRSRNRFRFRLRYGFEKDLGDDWKVGFRLASATAGTNGIATDNTSTNVTLGNPGYFAYKNIFIDRAFAEYSPNGLKDYGLLKGVTIGAGKFDNPFLRYSTWMMWDADATPEGLYEKGTLQLLSSEENKLNLHGTAGQFILNENSGIDTDAQMFGYQGALEWQTYNFNADLPTTFSFAASYYDTDNFSRTIANNTTGASFLRTNTSRVDGFGIVDLYSEVQLYPVGRTPVTLWHDYLVNSDNVGTEDPGALGNEIHDSDEGWGAGLRVGRAKKKGEWEAHYGYYELGANAAIAAFNDSDFGGPGGTGHTNRKGHKFGFSYMLTDSVSVNWTGYVVRPLNPTAQAGSSANEHVFRSQADVVWKF